ncbi:carboxymuconolactone decarboxylase family protein [Leptospira sp. 201903074]|uniref:carboxymuconolactone decarboxylase family protein n=1 Tax=Leptospira abararensis TaxID=2810036 RepID=UPI001964C7F7|nr:carboxymuconolactone decarboxylase family protein [Leptospira abararensis]MBM9548252.1 carboxymuconolactone decarboxylase family protein [Leptospira abararensis]
MKKFVECIVIVLLGAMIQEIKADNTENSNQSLTLRQQHIVTIAAFTAKGKTIELNPILHEGLDFGLTISEVKEILVHTYAYAGFPRSLNGLNVLMQVLKEREKNGIKDKLGTDARPLTTNKSKLEIGTEIQTQLIGAPIRGEVYTFAPVIDQFLKEHLFADIFSRDSLDFQSREIATISILASIGDAEAQLRSHMKVALNVGLTESQLRHLVSILELKVSWQDGQEAKNILDHILVGDSKIRITSPEEVSVKNQNFTGKVWVEILVGDDRTWNTQIGNVTFSPSSRTNWHFHPGGQILLITKGKGYYQEKGKSVRIVKAGDIIQCPPNTQHWHGATPSEEFSHIAIGTNMQVGPVTWLEPVSEAEYSSQ